MQATENKKSLRDVCVLLFEKFGKQKKGYKENDIIELVKEVSGKDFSEFFTKYVYTPNDFEVPLKVCFDYVGIDFIKQVNPNNSENFFGFKTVDANPVAKVTLVAPYSPAWKAGLFAGDEIIAVNDVVVKNNFNQWLHYFLTEEEIRLTVNSSDHLKTVSLQKDKKGNTYFFIPELKLKSAENASDSAFNIWKTH
jgi:predicted metalloprotease with PDZ domain